MKDVCVVASMLAVELLDVTVNTVSKAAMKRGMNDFVFVMYSNAFAACFLLPLTLIFHRKQTLRPLTYCIVGQLFVMGLLSSCFNLSRMGLYVCVSCSCSIQMLRFFGIGYSSPTLASAMSDLVPAFTFIFAVVCRMEKLDYKSNSTQAKSFGTLVSITGALIITLYKGQPVIGYHPSDKFFPEKLLSSAQFDWVIGAVLLAAHSCILSLLFIIQTWVIREYPAELLVILIRTVVVSVLSVPAVLISTKDSEAWRLSLDMELIAIGCSAVFSVSFRSVVHIWAMKKKGPVYVAMFKPLEIVFAVVMGITFLGDILYLGSVIGAAIVVLGFYAVIWGKTQEDKVEENCEVYSSASNSPEVPLLS